MFAHRQIFRVKYTLDNRLLDTRQSALAATAAKAVANTQHQVVGILKVIEAVANMDKGIMRETYLEGQQLVETIEHARLGIDEVATDTEVDGKIRHHILTTH